MPALSAEVLWSKLAGALPEGTRPLTEADTVRPALWDVPRLGRVRVYLWTLTEDRSKLGARPAGEFKIQLIVPDQSSGEYASLTLSPYPTLLLGYSPDLGVFVGWEARLYTHFAYSANVQVRDELLLQAREEGWAVATPRTSQGHEEVRVAFDAPHLDLFLETSIEADRLALEGHRREAFFLSRAPAVETQAVPADSDELPDYIANTRRIVTSSRLSRDARFAGAVKREYDNACAVCTAQLGIVEAAHIIPASFPTGHDELWNGIALCPNHHKLFDCRLYAIDENLIVRVDKERVDFLLESRMGSCIEQITDYDGEEVLPPNFWDKESTLRTQMQKALVWVLTRAGMRR